MNKCMFGLKLADKVSNDNIRKKTSINDARKITRSLKYQWAGHICRIYNNRWTKRLTEWLSKDLILKKGRPIKRWKDIFKQRCGSYWTGLAREVF